MGGVIIIKRVSLEPLRLEAHHGASSDITNSSVALSMSRGCLPHDPVRCQYAGANKTKCEEFFRCESAAAEIKLAAHGANLKCSFNDGELFEKCDPDCLAWPCPLNRRDAQSSTDRDIPNSGSLLCSTLSESVKIFP